MATNTYVALATQTVGSAVASVTFSSIPQGYTDLILVANYTTTVANLDVRLQVNGDTGSNYSNTYLLGNGSSAGSGRSSNATYAGQYFAVGTSTNGNTSVYNFMNYSNTTTYKTILHRMSSAEKELTANVTLWRGSTGSATQAITSITLFTNTNAFAIGSTFTVYGIAAEPQATAKATGGTITYGVEYTYHTFTSSGTFTPSQNLTCDYLVVGGGGGGGIDFGGGGGAGGYRTASSVAFTAASHTVTVGGPGVGGNRSNGSIGGTGTASSISGGSLTTFSAAGGGGGGAIFADPTNGGSGGGGWGGYANMVGTVVGQGNTPSTTPSQGNNGGLGYAPSGYGSNRYGGGGGGATAVGSNATSGSFGIGGAGATTTFSGSSVTYARGGNGCESQSFSGAASGAANTGNGGQGGGENYAGGSGGSGIVIIRYAN